MSLHSFEASACCWENIARVYVWEVAVEDSNHDKARRTMLFQVSKNCNSVWSLASPTPVFLLIQTWQRCVTYKEFPGTRRELIQHRVHVCVLLLDFHFQTEGADKVWRLLWKTNRWCPRLSKTLEIHFPRGSLWPRYKKKQFEQNYWPSFCLPEHRPDSLHTGASRIFSPSLSESARCF